MSLIIKNNSTSATSLDEANGNLMGTITTTAMTSSASRNNNNNDDDSTSEYTDPENSAPTELLAEFLTSIMRKDYVNALHYCKLILEFEPNNNYAKDFYPELVMRVNEHQQTSSNDGSDENCNGSSSLEIVDNEILDNDMIDDENSYSDSSSISSSNSNSTTNGSMDLNSYSDEDENPQNHEQDDLLNQLSSCSSNSSKSDPFPESMSSSESIDHRFDGSPSFSFTSLLLEESDELNGNNNNIDNESSSAQVQQLAPSVVATTAPTISSPSSRSSPFTSKIVNMIKRKLN